MISLRSYTLNLIKKKTLLLFKKYRNQGFRKLCGSNQKLLPLKFRFFLLLCVISDTGEQPKHLFFLTPLHSRQILSPSFKRAMSFSPQCLFSFIHSHLLTPHLLFLLFQIILFNLSQDNKNIIFWRHSPALKKLKIRKFHILWCLIIKKPKIKLHKKCKK